MTCYIQNDTRIVKKQLELEEEYINFLQLITESNDPSIEQLTTDGDFVRRSYKGFQNYLKTFGWDIYQKQGKEKEVIEITVHILAAYCPKCDQVKRYLDAHKITYKERVITQDLLDRYDAYESPIVVISEDDWFSGFNKERLDELIERCKR
jgi:glutaredoxin